MLSLFPKRARHGRVRSAAEDVRCLMSSFKFKYQRHKGGYAEKGCLQHMQSFKKSPWLDLILPDFSFPNPVSGCFDNFSGIPLCWFLGAPLLTCDPSRFCAPIAGTGIKLVEMGWDGLRQPCPKNFKATLTSLASLWPKLPLPFPDRWTLSAPSSPLV